jgi:ParB family chromosome partitioning protein
MQRDDSYDVYQIPVASIVADDEFNCRGPIAPGSVTELVDSIAELGLESPIHVRPIEGDRYLIISGHRRFAAVSQLGWEKIPCRVRNVSQKEALVLNLVENLERKDLNILQEASALKKIYPSGVSLRQASNELHRPTRWVAARLKLLTLPESVQQMAAAGLLSSDNIVAIAKLPRQEQEDAAKAIIAAKKSGKKALRESLPPKYRATFQARKSKNELLKMAAKLLTLNVYGFETWTISWACGYISDAQFLEKCRENGLAARIQRLELAVQLMQQQNQNG